MPAKRKTTQAKITKLRLELDAPATPTLVMQVAKMFQDALRASGEDIDAESVTMVVENFSACAEIRGRDESGIRAVTAISSVIEDPVKAVQRNPRNRLVADAIASGGAGFKTVRGKFKAGRRTVATFDETFINGVRGASVDQRRVAMRGRDQIYSRVLRVGRLVDDGPIKVRVHLGSAIRDLDLAGSPEPFIRALESERRQCIDVETEWTEGRGGTVEMNAGKTIVLSLREVAEPMTGAELIDGFADALDPLAAESFMASVEADL